MGEVMRREIQERQNSEGSLDRLAAQRLLYQTAKTAENWRLVLVLFVAAVLLTGLALGSVPFSQGATMAILLSWFIDQVVLARCSGRMKEEAAAIQEDFDCFVLDMPWPKHLGVARPTKDRVEELANKASRQGLARKQLADWYPCEGIPMEAVAACLHCQRVNCRWDSRLRGEWVWWVRFMVLALIVLGVAVGAIVGVTLAEVVLGVAAGIRLLTWLFMEQRAQSVAQKRMQYLHGYLSRYETESDPMTLCDVRLVQAAIFEHRRTCPTVPDWFYRIKRTAYEDIARS